MAFRRIRGCRTVAGLAIRSQSLSELLDLGEMGVYSFYTVLLCYNISGCVVLPSPGVAMKISDPFLSSLMAQTSLRRLAGIVAILVPLWLMIAWAVSLP